MRSCRISTISSRVRSRGCWGLVGGSSRGPVPELVPNYGSFQIRGYLPHKGPQVEETPKR